jgi:hypothetical protein
MKPILQSATGGLHSVSAEVIDKHDQYEVFNDPRAVRRFDCEKGPILTFGINSPILPIPSFPRTTS